MEIAKDIRDFLMSRRAKVTPEQVGLPPVGRRRVPGLRREEVARLAGVSTEYYIQVERGRVAGVSDEVLHAVATALLLEEEEATHLFDLARAATSKTGKPRTRTRPARAAVPDSAQALMDAMVLAPAVVQNAHLDLLATNALGRELYAPVFERASGTPNLARFIFLDPQAKQVFPDWNEAAEHVVGLLRVAAARSPYSTDVTGLIGELATRSEQFRTRWAAHNIRTHQRGSKRFHHHLIGDLTLRFEALTLAGDSGLALVGYTAEPNTPSDEALRLLASWTTSDHSRRAVPTPAVLPTWVDEASDPPQA